MSLLTPYWPFALMSASGRALLVSAHVVLACQPERVHTSSLVKGWRRSRSRRAGVGGQRFARQTRCSRWQPRVALAGLDRVNSLQRLVDHSVVASSSWGGRTGFEGRREKRAGGSGRHVNHPLRNPSGRALTTPQNPAAGRFATSAAAGCGGTNAQNE